MSVSHATIEERVALHPPVRNTEWLWWAISLTGKPQTFDPLAPQTGFFRYRFRMADRGVPAALWFADGAWVALVDGVPADDPALVWRWCHKHPISEALYHAVIDGAPWPDEVAATEATPSTGHNSAQPEAVALDEIAAADKAFADWLKRIGGTIRDEEHDQTAKGYDARIVKLRQEAEAARVEEKDVHLRAGQAVDAKWKPVKTAALAAETRISAAVTGYRKERKRLADEAARIEREARDAERQAQAAAKAAAEAEGKAFLPPAMPTAQRSSPKPTGLRTIKRAEITDLPALAAQLAAQNNIEMREVCERIALRMLVSGAKVVGATLVIDIKA